MRRGSSRETPCQSLCYGHEVLTTFAFRDLVYSLKDHKLLWQHSGKDSSRGICPPLIPLLVGKDRVYFARRTPSNGYDLEGVKLQNGELLYRTPLITKAANTDYGFLKQNVLELIPLSGEDELILQYDSERLLTTGVPRSGSLSIINGANGQVLQKIDCGKFGRPGMVRSTTTSFSLASRGVAAYSFRDRRDVMTVQTFSRQADGSFTRTLVRAVALLPRTLSVGSVMVGPVTLQAFSLRFDDVPSSLTIRSSLYFDDIRKLAEQLTPVKVDEYYRVVWEQPLTLPPRKRGRRFLNLARDGHGGSLMVLDERRVILDRSRSKDQAVYLFDFTPEW